MGLVRAMLRAARTGRRSSTSRLAEWGRKRKCSRPGRNRKVYAVRLRNRRFLLFSSTAVSGAGACAALVALGVLDPWTAAQALLLAAVCGSVAFLALLVRRNSVQVRLLRRSLDRHLREVAEIAGENRAELFGRADELTDRLDAVAESVAGLRADLAERDSEVEMVGGSAVHARAAS